jgi:hypothetical protein
MTLSFQVNGALAVIPGIYSILLVSDSLPAPAPAGQSVCIVGEADEGIPGDLLNLGLNYFDNYPDVLAYYKSGSIVDAARMCFTRQPSPVFTGAVQRLYIYKTNQSTRAQKTIVSPTNYGAIVAGVFGDSGNLIKSQIQTATAEILPSVSFQYLPDVFAASDVVSINGSRSSAISLSALADGSVFASDLTTVFGGSGTVSGGLVRTTLTASTNLTVTANGDVLTFTAASGFGTTAKAGDVAMIPVGSVMAGGGNENAGVYSVVSWSDTVISLQQLKHFLGVAEVAPVAFNVSAVTGAIAASISVVSPISVQLTASPGAGLGGSMELGVVPGDTCQFSSLSAIISSNSASVGNITATAATTDLTITLTSGASWMVIPDAGDQIFIGRTSVLAAGTSNVGLWTVVSATGTTMVIRRTHGISATPVDMMTLNGQTTTVLWAPGFTSSSIAPVVLSSPAERSIMINATRVTDNATFTTSSVGGNVAFTLGYAGAVSSSAMVTIDPTGTLTVTVDSVVLVSTKLARFPTMLALATFLNSQTNLIAEIPNARFNSISPTVLDMVSNAHIATALIGVPSAPCRIKKDYSDFVAFMNANFGLIAFAAGTLVYQAGLPAAESVSSFLVGGAVGGTSNADIQSGLDAALKIDIQNIVPLFSRDAFLDVQDGLTDQSSTYTISSILAAATAEVSTASGDLAGRRRYAQVSFHGSFEDAKTTAGSLGYERDQMAFQMFNALDSTGSLAWFLPWMGSVAVATSRAQGALGTPLLRKPINVSNVKHIGAQSVYSDTLVLDFDPEDPDMLSEAIEAGLLVWRSVSGQGVRMESPDLTTRSRTNDPQGWVWERANVLTVLDAFEASCKSVLDNFIGNRTTDTPAAVIQTAIEGVISAYVSAGAIKKGSVDKVTSLGNGYSVVTSVYPAEAVESIVVNVVAKRDVSASA